VEITDALDTVCRHPERDRLLSLEHLLTYIPKSAARVLDCTGTPGQRGVLLKRHGARTVCGLLDESMDVSLLDSGYDAYTQGPLDFVALPDGGAPFDCILCTSALERLRNPDMFLQRIVAALAPGGLLLAVVPNMQYHKIVSALARGRWVYGDSGVWDRQNLRFYTGHEIRALFGRAGLGSCRVASLVRDREEEFPRDTEGYARAGALRFGPLNDATYPSWLTEYFLAMAVKPEGAI